MIQPRYYQLEAHKATLDYLKNKEGNPVIALPTGTGKALALSMFVMESLFNNPFQKILVVTHISELIAQNVKELLNLWPNAPIGINSSALKRRDFNQNVIFCGIASIVKNWDKFGKVSTVIVDECHLISPNQETMYGSLINNLKSINPLLRVIGYSATPYRLGQGLLTDGGIFTDICYDLTNMEGINRLIREGYMTTLIPPKTHFELDLSEVKIGFDGDFAKGELQIAVDKYEITLAALKEARERAEDRHCWLVFASGIEHCEHISEILNMLGISNVVIHSKITQTEREERFALWMNGKVKAIIGYRVLTTGLNHPPIDCIVDLYPTTSTSLHIQKLGRGTRPYDPDIQTKYRENFPYLKENALVLDFGGNTARLGPINDPVLPRKKGEKGSGGAPVKVCNVCGCYNHASARFCIGCNAEFTLQVKIKEEVSHAELIKSDLPEFKTYTVDHITYSEHKKVGGKPSLKVSYFSKLKIFTEYICIEHLPGSFPKRKADQWWMTRAGTTSPNSILSAIYLTDQLLKPSSIVVQVNKKYPEITDYIFNDERKIESKTIEPILNDFDRAIALSLR